MTTPRMQNPLEQTDLVDWGVIPTMIEGESRTSGKLIHKGPDGQSECGLWVCTPGKWECHVSLLASTTSMLMSWAIQCSVAIRLTTRIHTSLLSSIGAPMIARSMTTTWSGWSVTIAIRMINRIA